MKRRRQYRTNSKGHDAAFADLMSDVRSEADKELETLGRAVYADRWEQVLAHNVKRLTGGNGELTLSQKWQLIKALRVLRPNL